MNHPNVEEFAGLMYEELDASRREEVQRHLAACDECRARLSAWQATRRELTAWELPDAARSPAVSRTASHFGPALKWSVAAMLLIGTGFGLARLNPPKSPDLSAMRAGIIRDLRGELASQSASDRSRFIAEQATRNANFARAMVNAVNDLESRQTVVNASLRRDIVTLAVNAQKRFDQVAVADHDRSEKTVPPQQQQ